MKSLQLEWLACFLIGGFLCVQGQKCACQSTGGCSFRNICLPVGNCNKRNIALGKEAIMSSTYNNCSRDEISGPACLAVNGNTDTAFRPVNKFRNNPNCVHTADGDKSAYWQVDLGQEEVIAGFTVIARNTQAIRMSDVKITVDSKQRYMFPANHRLVKTEIPIRPPALGRLVRLSKGTPGKESFINFCELQVWACEDGYYKSDCTKCGACLNAAPCDKVSGNCSNGCEAGWEGFRCFYHDTYHAYYYYYCKEECGLPPLCWVVCPSFDGQCIFSFELI